MTHGLSSTLLQWRRGTALATALALALTSLPAPSVWAAPTTLATRVQPTAASLDLSALTVPEALGFVIETWQPSEVAPKGFVIHLQDAHANPEAQAHLSQLIGELRQRVGVERIALEGAAGPLDTTLFSDFPDPESTQQLATLFRDESLFTGAEEYAITHPGALTLWGVEDDALYRAHLDISQQSRAHQADTEATLTALSAALAPLKAALYPTALQHLQALRAAYDRNDGVTLQTYLTELAQQATAAQLDLAAYPMVALALRLYERAAESSEAERADLRPALLLEQMDALARAVEDAALSTESQRTLARLLRQVMFLDGLVHARLSPTEYEDYQRLRSSLTADSLWDSLSRITNHDSRITQSAVASLLTALPAHERFYELAHQRDTALVRNTLKLLHPSPSTPTLLF